MKKVKALGNKSISYKDKDYHLLHSSVYELDEDTAKLFVENGYCNYLENGKNTSKQKNKD